MKRTSIAIVLISIVALVFAAGFIYLLLEKKDYSLSIRDIAAGSWEPVGGLVYIRWFNVTIQNDGPGNVGGVTLDYRITDNQTSINTDLMWYEPEQIGIIHAGESRLIRLVQTESLLDLGNYSGCTFVATLMLDDHVLDEKTLVL